MNTTEAIIHMPRCLIAHDFGVVLGWKGIDTGPRVRREYRAGRLPGPIDPSLPPNSWSWSPDVVAAYINPTAAA